MRVKTGRLDWSAHGSARVAQNVCNLIHTWRYEVAYHRTMGLPTALIDSPSPAALAELEVEVRQLLARYEPRARVREIVCGLAPDGQLEIEVELL